MYKSIFILFIMIACSLTAFGAKYKVNSKGQVTSPSGTVQHSSSLNSNFYNNYNSKSYVSSKQVLAKGVGYIDIVMDYSGSMLYWIGEAKKSMSAIISQLPQETNIGFRAFGYDNGNNPYDPVLANVKQVIQKKDGSYRIKAATASYLGSTSGSCSSTKQLARIASNNSMNLINGMNSVDVGGSTPLTLALEQAVEKDFSSIPQSVAKKIILITDGGENCGGDPCAFAAQLKRKRSDITIDVLLVSSNSTELKCVSDITGGNFYTTADVYGFTSTLYDSMSKPVENNNLPQQKYEFIGN